MKLLLSLHSREDATDTPDPKRDQKRMRLRLNVYGTWTMRLGDGGVASRAERPLARPHHGSNYLHWVLHGGALYQDTEEPQAAEARQL